MGSYQEHREKTLHVEQQTPWEQKINKLMWRGSMRVGTADRESLMAVAQGHDWNDIRALDWEGELAAARCARTGARC